MTSTESGLLVAAFGILLTGALSFFVYLNTQIQNLRTEVAKLSVQVSPLWSRVQAQIASDLHHPHPRYLEMDGLLEKLEALTITTDERVRLKELLVERSVDEHADISEVQRKQARIMVDVMDVVLAEQRNK
jgi:hypothetical protein